MLPVFNPNNIGFNEATLPRGGSTLVAPAGLFSDSWSSLLGEKVFFNTS